MKLKYIRSIIIDSYLSVKWRWDVSHDEDASEDGLKPEHDKIDVLLKKCEYLRHKNLSSPTNGCNRFDTFLFENDHLQLIIGLCIVRPRIE